MLDKLNAALQFQQEALNLRAQRQEILSANIANADTPGYQARDIDFASQLQKVMEQGRASGSGMSLALTSDRHIPASNVQPADMDLMYRILTSRQPTVTRSIWIVNVLISRITACAIRPI